MLPQCARLELALRRRLNLTLTQIQAEQGESEKALRAMRYLR